LWMNFRERIVYACIRLVGIVIAVTKASKT
jgi:hypothetical protein